MNTDPRTAESKPCPDTPLPSDRAFKTWQTLASIGFVLTLMVSLYVWTHVDADGVQQSIAADEVRVRELGIVLLEVTQPDHTAFVTAETIQRDQLGKFVFAQDLKHPNVFVRKSVTAEPRSDGRTRILHGLHTGDQIVVSGAERLRLEPPQAAETSGGTKPETK